MKKAENKQQKLTSNQRARWDAFTFIILALVIFYSIYLFIQIAWVFMKSLQDFQEYILSGASAAGIPSKWSLMNYVNVFNEIKIALPRHMGERYVYFAEMFLNSLIYATIVPFTGIAANTVLAYVTVKHRFWFNKVLNGIYYWVMLVPLIGAMGSTVQVHTSLGLQDTWIGMAILRMGFTGGTGYLVLQAAFKSLDDGYKEAAIIDGASHFRVMFLICIPLIKSVLFVLYINSFIGYWSDYQTPMIYLPTKYTASYGLYIFNNMKTSAISYLPYKLTGFMILMFPCFIIFLVFKDMLLKGMNLDGGLKG